MLKEVVREWLESGVGLKDDKMEGSASTGMTAAQDEAQQLAGRKETDEAVFMSSYIPRNLGEVYDPERDIDVIAAGKGDDLIYAGLTGVSGTNASSGSTGRPKSALKNASDPTADESKKGGVKWEDEQDEDESDDDDEEDNEDDDKEKRPRGFRHEDKDSKKVSRHENASRSSLVVLTIYAAPRCRSGKRRSRRKSERSDRPRCQRRRRLVGSSRQRIPNRGQASISFPEAKFGWRRRSCTS